MKNVNTFILGAIGGLIAGVILASSIDVLKVQPVETKNRDGGFVGYVQNGEQTELFIPHDLRGSSTTVIVSPDGKTMAYAYWEDVGYSFYLTDFHGSFVEKISRQHVGEGSGGVLIDSFRWSQDGMSISYIENALTCRGTCNEPDEFESVNYEYTVDIVSKVETVEEAE